MQLVHVKHRCAWIKLHTQGAIYGTPLSLQVGASNELPESEELDALYDRFLIRRQVSQVSDVGLPAMLAAAADNNLAVCLMPHAVCYPVKRQGVPFRQGAYGCIYLC